jgi:hypothetical protein
MIMNDKIGSVAAGFLTAILGLAIVAVVVSNRSSSSGVITGIFSAFQGLVTTAIGGATAGSANIPNSNVGASGSSGAGNLTNMANSATNFANSASSLHNSVSNLTSGGGADQDFSGGSGSGVTTIYNDASQPGTTIYENDN